jgi:catechol O-methyltransferase
VIDLIHEFEKDYYLMNVGPEKGKIVTDIIDEQKPKTMIELGCYVGYSAILFGDAVRRNGGERYLSLELNPEFAAIANMLVELAGLRDFVRIIVGRSDLSLHKLITSKEVTHVELLFIDHYKPAYTTDLKLCEHHAAIGPGSVLVADNVLYPGNPPYLEYVRSSVEQKREVAKAGPSKGYDTTGMADWMVQSFVGKDDVPTFQYVGNPNLVYESRLCQPEGMRVSVKEVFPGYTFLLTVIGLGCHRGDKVCG